MLQIFSINSANTPSSSPLISLCIHTCMLLTNIALSSLYFAETSSFNSECYFCSFVPLFIIQGFTWNMHETQMDSPVHKHFHKWICPVQIFMWTDRFSLFKPCMVLLPVNWECFQEQSIETCRLKQFRHWIVSAYHIPLGLNRFVLYRLSVKPVWLRFSPRKCSYHHRVYMMQYLFCYGPFLSHFLS